MREQYVHRSLPVNPMRARGKVFGSASVRRRLPVMKNRVGRNQYSFTS
jgi:hypothetical protein